MHLDDPRIAPRYADSDVAAVEHAVATFFIEGSGGPAVYEGQDMPTAHRGMNIDDGEFVAAIDDAMEALDKNGIGQRERRKSCTSSTASARTWSGSDGGSHAAHLSHATSPDLTRPRTTAHVTCGGAPS